MSKSTRINLLPWRDIARREQDKKIFGVSAALWVLTALAVGLSFLWMNGKIDYQNERNVFEVEDEIKEINEIRKQKDHLIARMEIIQQLQRDRTQVVHVFDDMVRKLPKGVYFTKLKKLNRDMTIEGFAQSNARVSSLMRNLESSEWFTAANLDVINVTDGNESGARVSKFNLKVKQTSIKDEKQEGTNNAKSENLARRAQVFWSVCRLRLHRSRRLVLSHQEANRRPRTS